MKYIKKFEAKTYESKKSGVKRYQVDDFIILQGKDAESNDSLTFELSNDDDIWLHAKGVPGSHVLIKVRDKIPQNEILKKAAEIAAKNSKAERGDVKVVYCKKKFVKKEKGMNAGQVSVDYINANEIIVRK